MYAGIDQSLNGTGLCLRDADGVVHTAQTIDPGKLRDVQRLAYVKARVMSFLSDRVKFVAFEGYSYNSVGRVFELGEIGGVLRLLVHEHGLPYVVIPPLVLKKFATGNPAADKEDMVSFARQAGFAARDDNQADAFFLAEIARCHHLELAPPNRAQLEVLHSIRSPKVKKPARRVRRLTKNSI